MDQLPRLGKRQLICLLLFTCNYVVSGWRGFFFLWVLGMGHVILLWDSLNLPYIYFSLEYHFFITQYTASNCTGVSAQKAHRYLVSGMTSVKPLKHPHKSHHAQNEPLSHDHRNLIIFLMQCTFKVHEALTSFHSLTYRPKRSHSCLIEEMSFHFTGLSWKRLHSKLTCIHLQCVVLQVSSHTFM